jgi:hypothetical protein
MKTLLANKQTEEQKRSNEYARYQFILAMMNMDERMIGSLLKKESKFLGNLNNWQLLHWLKSQFSVLNPQMFHSKFTEGVSLDVYPGSDMFQFSFAPMDDENSNGLFFTENQDEDAVFSCQGSFKIELVLLFENGVIADIRIPKKITCLDKSKRFQIEN